MSNLIPRTSALLALCLGLQPIFATINLASAGEQGKSAQIQSLSQSALVQLLLEQEKEDKEVKQAKDAIAQARQDLKDNKVNQIFLNTATGVTVLGTALTFVISTMQFRLGMDYSSKNISPTAKILLGVEVVVDGALIYFDVRAAKERTVLRAKLREAESALKQRESELESTIRKIKELLPKAPK